MADLVGGVDEVSSLAEEGVDPSGNDNSFNLTLFDSGARKDFIAGHLGNGQRLSGEGGLVNFERISIQETSIGRNDVS